MVDFIKEYFPTALSKVVTTLIVTVVPSSLFLYDFLKNIGVEIAYLAKPEVRIAVALALLSLFLIIIVVNLLKFQQKTSQKEQLETIESNNETITPNMLELSILAQVIKFRALNQSSSPVSIAKTIGSEPGIVLAHLNKLHNEQQVTYITGGNPPTVETDFFICPKGLEKISLQVNKKKKTRRIRNLGIEN